MQRLYIALQKKRGKRPEVPQEKGYSVLPFTGTLCKFVKIVNRAP
jgi:hypothetical protein